MLSVRSVEKNQVKRLEKNVKTREPLHSFVTLYNCCRRILKDIITHKSRIKPRYPVQTIGGATIMEGYLHNSRPKPENH